MSQTVMRSLNESQIALVDRSLLRKRGKQGQAARKMRTWMWREVKRNLTGCARVRLCDHSDPGTDGRVAAAYDDFMAHLRSLDYTPPSRYRSELFPGANLPCSWARYHRKCPETRTCVPAQRDCSLSQMTLSYWLLLIRRSLPPPAIAVYVVIPLPTRLPRIQP